MAAAPDFTARTVASPDASLRLEMEDQWDPRDGPSSILCLKNSAGETLIQLWNACWEDNANSPRFDGATVELDLIYHHYRCRARIDTAARTFVFHPHEYERPLSELGRELSAAAFPPRKGRLSAHRRTVARSGSWWVLLTDLMFVAGGLWMLLERHPVRPASPWIAALCILFFGLGAAVELRELLRRR